MSAGALVLKLRLGALELDLNDTDDTGFLISAVDIGSATPREVVTDLPGQDGQDDQTAYFGPRSVQLTGAIVPTLRGWSRTKAKDKLAPFLAASARPTLVYALDTDVDIRCIDLRVGQWSNVIDHPQNASAFSVQWVGKPIAYGASVNEVDLVLSSGSSAGFGFPFSFPFAFDIGGSGPTEPGLIANVGTYPSWPILRIYGPCSDPSVVWIDPLTGLSNGTQVIFSGLTIDSGDYAEVDTQKRTVLINGDPGANRYNFVDFARTSWGQLAVGLNLLRFSAAEGSGDCITKVLWRESYLD
jgi:hypothetical protein